MRFTLVFIAILLPAIICRGYHGFVQLTNDSILRGEIKRISLGEEEVVEFKSVKGIKQIFPAWKVRRFGIVRDTDTAVFITLHLKSHPDAAHGRLRFAEIVYRGDHIGLLRFRGLGFAYHYLQYIPFARRRLVPLLYYIDFESGNLQQITPTFMKTQLSLRGHRHSRAKGKRRSATYTALIKKIDTLPAY